MEKNAELSVEFRERANIEYKKCNLPAAIRGYNLAIVFGRPGGEEISLAFANRAAILLHIKEPELALKDIQLAEENKFPEKLKDKLIERKKKCEVMILELERKRKETEELSPEEGHGKGESSMAKKKKKFVQDYCQNEFFTLRQASQSVIGAEDFVRIDSSEARGRRVVVDKDVKAGENELKYKYLLR